jgi:uncharacterized protein (TIGR02594 family)
VTPFDLAQRYVGTVLERPGGSDHPLIQWWLSLCGFGLDAHDEVPWCSAFANGIAWELRLPRSKSAAARSWLAVGLPVGLGDARPGHDVVVIQRGDGKQPGPEVLNAQGHVGWFAGVEGKNVLILGGNQGNQVSVASFPVSRLLGIRRLA